MANIGMMDIENFDSKIRFALLVIPAEEVIKRVREQYGESLTSVTLNAWKSGKNRPNKRKLKLVTDVLGIEITDFYLDFDAFADFLSEKNSLSPKNRKIFKIRVKEQLVGSLKLKAFSKYGTDYLERLYKKIRGRYILYNYSMSNIPRVNLSLIQIKTMRVPFIGVTLQSLRDRQLLHYRGTLFAVRSTLQMILETEDVYHDEVVSITLNNPVDTARKVRFLHGVILAGSEDFISHPSAARVFMEKLPASYSHAKALKILADIDADSLPKEYLNLITNDLAQEHKNYVLRAEQLNAADMELLKQVSLVEE